MISAARRPFARVARFTREAKTLAALGISRPPVLRTLDRVYYLRRFVPRNLAGVVLAVLAAGAGAVSCGSPAGPSSGCGGTLSFTTLPVPFGAILNVSPLGNLNPASHTIPTDHVYFYLNGIGIALSSPGAFRITAVRTTHYLASTFRAGQSDYSVYGSLCEGYQLALAHIQTVVSKIQSQTGRAVAREGWWRSEGTGLACASTTRPRATSLPAPPLYRS